MKAPENQEDLVERNIRELIERSPTRIAGHLALDLSQLPAAYKKRFGSDLKTLYPGLKLKPGWLKLKLKCMQSLIIKSDPNFAARVGSTTPPPDFVALRANGSEVQPSCSPMQGCAKRAPVSMPTESCRPQATIDELLTQNVEDTVVETTSPKHRPLGSSDAKEAAPEGLSNAIEAQVVEMFHGAGRGNASHRAPNFVSSDARHLCAESALLGSLINDEQNDDSGATADVYLNVNQPFCLIAVGVQGGGKSHTVAVVLESCLLPCAIPARAPIVELHKPMSALVLHYDQSETNVCEATGLVSPNPDLERLLEGTAATPSLGVSTVVILVSPTFYRQRKKFYGSSSQYVVLPLLFRWKALDAVQLKKLMRINEGDNQLYIGMMLSKLREYQRKGGMPEFCEFCDEMMAACCSGQQSGPLAQRLELLKQFVAESEENEELYAEQADLSQLLAGGTLVVADLTDPMLAPAEANGVFQVLLEQFRMKELDCGKIVVCDEAHRYFDAKAKGGDGLAGAIVDTVRLMRHEGIRVVISTQSPLTMPPELLELSTMAVCHSFHSQDWYDYLSSKLPLPDDGFAAICGLEPGEALAYASRPLIRQQSTTQKMTQHTFLLQVRPRLTQDRGYSRCNRTRKDRQLPLSASAMTAALEEERIDVEPSGQEQVQEPQTAGAAA
jgi:hypothetical protein